MGKQGGCGGNCGSCKGKGEDTGCASKNVKGLAAGMSSDEMLAELRSRGAFAEVSGAAGALYDHLERVGALTSENAHTSYLMYRLRRDLAKVDSEPKQGADSVAFWQSKIAELEAAAT